MNEASADSRFRVVIAGGGVAGLEALIALHHLAGDRVEVTLVAPDEDFVYKPMLVGEPFAAEPAERRALAPIAAEFGARFLKSPLTRVDADKHRVALPGQELSYDALMVCVGARSRAAYRNALTFHAAGEPLDLRAVLATAERAVHLAFVVPAGVSWSLPIYELALMAERQARQRGIAEVRCTIVTPEERPLALFGTVASAAVAELLEGRGIEVVSNTTVRETDTGELMLIPGSRPLRAEAVVALPRLSGPNLPGVPADGDGFIRIDDYCRVRGLAHVYGAGDGTDFPVKQGGLATQQADTAAEQVAAEAGAPVEPRPFRPVLRGMLLTGEESLFARQDLTGGSGEGIASEDYLWWPPHKIGGRYLPAWLAHEEPPEDLEPPRHALDVELALPHEWHEQPMAMDS